MMAQIADIQEDFQQSSTQRHKGFSTRFMQLPVLASSTFLQEIALKNSQDRSKAFGVLESMINGALSFNGRVMTLIK